MKTLGLADSEELGMFSVFDGFWAKKGWFLSSSSFNSRPFPYGTGEIPASLSSFPNRPRRRRPRSRPFPSGTSGTPAACFSLFLLSYVQPCNRPQSVIDHEDNDDEDDYKDKED
jgi:hypothetical protein